MRGYSAENPEHALKIDTSSAQPPIAGPKSGSRLDGSASAGGQSAGSVSTSDVVDLSPAARQLSNLQNSDNDINVERVSELRDAIASGQLQINPDRIADAVIASARDLLK